MKNLNDFSLFVLAYREDHHLSKNKMAELLGVTKETIKLWEDGISNPRYDTLIMISRVTHTPVTHFFPIDCI